VQGTPPCNFSHEELTADRAKYATRHHSHHDYVRDVVGTALQLRQVRGDCRMPCHRIDATCTIRHRDATLRGRPFASLPLGVRNRQCSNSHLAGAPYACRIVILFAVPLSFFFFFSSFVCYPGLSSERKQYRILCRSPQPTASPSSLCQWSTFCLRQHKTVFSYMHQDAQAEFSAP